METERRRKKNFRPDRDGTHRKVFDRNKKLIYSTQSICGICGKVVDFSIRYPDPLSACIDHIIPVDKGGHPSDISNLQLAHRCCNRAKSDNLYMNPVRVSPSCRVLPQSRDWGCYKSEQSTGGT